MEGPPVRRAVLLLSGAVRGRIGVLGRLRQRLPNPKHQGPRRGHAGRVARVGAGGRLRAPGSGTKAAPAAGEDEKTPAASSQCRAPRPADREAGNAATGHATALRAPRASSIRRVGVCYASGAPKSGVSGASRAPVLRLVRALPRLWSTQKRRFRGATPETSKPVHVWRCYAPRCARNA